MRNETAFVASAGCAVYDRASGRGASSTNLETAAPFGLGRGAMAASGESGDRRMATSEHEGGQRPGHDEREGQLRPPAMKA
jgi:hypothetical protein